VLVDQEPGFAAAFPDAGVADLEVDGFAVFGFVEEVHGGDGPGDVAAASGFQFLAGGERDVGSAIKKFLPNARGVFFAAVVLKW
jgi:hypothetical protein